MLMYEHAANSRNFDKVGSLVADEAVFFFSDGSFTGIGNIRMAFENTWKTIKEETYSIRDLRWLHKSEDCAVCVYRFVSRGIINGEASQFEGRGTNILKRFGDK